MVSWFTPGTLASMSGGAQQNLIRQGVTVGTGWVILQMLGTKLTENLTVESTSWERAKARTSVNMVELGIFIAISYLIYGRAE